MITKGPSLNGIVGLRLTPRAALFLIAAAALLLRFVDPSTQTVYPTCPIHQYTGLFCPGCGATRALAALTHARLSEALHLNAFFVLVVLPFALAYLILACSRRHWPSLPRPMHYSLSALALLFTAYRNI